MSTREQDLKMRLLAVLRDLQENGKGDPESVWMIGSLAATLIDKAKAPSWPALKNGLTPEAYDRLLEDFRVQGNSLHQAGEQKKAYAIQALGISLVCRTQRHDRVLEQGESLLDTAINQSVAIFRRTQRVN